MPAAGRGGQRGGVGPGGLSPALDLDRDQPGVRDDGIHLLGFEAVVVRQVGAGGHPHGGPGLRDQTAEALGVVQIVVEQSVRDGALGEVVHTLPGAAFRTDHIAGVQQPLHRDLGLGPVPPLAAFAPATQLRSGERAIGLQAVQHGGAGALGVLHDVPAVALGAAGTPAEGEVRPLLDGEDAGGVRPVFKAVRRCRRRVGRSRSPVSGLDGVAAQSAEPGVRHQLMGAGQHRDRVQLHRAQLPQHPAHPARRSGAPSSPWARSAKRRASSRDRVVTGCGRGGGCVTAVMRQRVGAGTDNRPGDGNHRWWWRCPRTDGAVVARCGRGPVRAGGGQPG